jgi:hypothetical protein
VVGTQGAEPLPTNHHLLTLYARAVMARLILVSCTIHPGYPGENYGVTFRGRLDPRMFSVVIILPSFRTQSK